MIKRTILLSVLCLLLFSPAGMCSERTGTVPKEVFLQVLDEWEQSTNEFQTLLDAQNTDLTIASDELQSLKKSLAKQKEVQALLKKELNECKIELNKAHESLTEANKELQTIVSGVKDIESKKRLAERQRNAYGLLSVILGGLLLIH